jgi:hypothetical protein
MPTATTKLWPLENRAVDDQNDDRQTSQGAFQQFLQLLSAGLDEMLASGALLQAIGIRELLNYLLVTAHRQPEHDLLPDGIAQQRGTLKHFIASQTDFFSRTTSQPWTIERDALPVDDAVPFFDSPAIDVPLRVGLGTLPR